MIASTERILTTHTGSLPRAPELVELLLAQEQGRPVDAAELSRLMEAGIERVVTRQIEAGIDIGNDGEQPRVGFQTYVPQRMSGFGGTSNRGAFSDMTRFPGYAAILQGRANRRARIATAPQALSAVRYEDFSGIQAECAGFAAALRRHPGGFAEPFMTSASPGIVTTTMLNAHYDSHEAYVMAVAREMRKEWEHIVAQGHLLQIDAPDLALERHWFCQDEPLATFQAMVELHIEAINVALENIPPERARLHVCWGNYDGPHVDDVALADVLGLITRARVGALSVPFANPRHAHEMDVLRRMPLPGGMLLIPGVIDSTTNYVEHPELVAQRIAKAVEMVGDRERIIAGVDCGFSTFAGANVVAEDVVWEKLRTLRAGADIASSRLW
ncbi:MAG: cobalamin-independent methionine synthase II family protein [Candidatus Lambdaproteobacteria bacterium]|nr:cobalamin-independent methionine synthase II family protein [Candidatus Lambdaproteobacteria bacterium]